MPEENETQVKVDAIVEAMDTTGALLFLYSGSWRLVLPYVVGFSSEGNPLMRGYQVAGVSLSAKGAGWRVFQIVKMFFVDVYWDYFDAEFPDYNPSIPWIYEVVVQI
jgi:hypothetical protein